LANRGHVGVAAAEPPRRREAVPVIAVQADAEAGPYESVDVRDAISISAADKCDIRCVLRPLQRAVRLLAEAEVWVEPEREKRHSAATKRAEVGEVGMPRRKNVVIARQRREEPA